MIRALLLAPFLLVLIAFALSNQQMVSLSLWPTDVSLEVPLSIAVLSISAVSFFLGAILVWFPALRHRLRASQAKKRIATLESKLKAYDKPDPGVKLLTGPR
jgi:uncharacterized integral membrane protein